MINQKFLLKLCFPLCLFLTFSSPSLADNHTSPIANLLNQLKIEVKPKSSFLKKERVEWQYSASAKPLSLKALPSIPPALQQIDALQAKVTAPVALGDLLSSAIKLQPGDQVTIHSFNVHLGQAHLKANGKVKYFADDDWVGKITIEAHNVDKYLDELLQSGAIRQPHAMTLKFILSGFSLAGAKTHSKKQPLKVVVTLKDKMLWVQELPICPISALFKHPSEKPDEPQDILPSK
ncbi:MAG: DUF2125 domain-containing protein [Alphaproteobacteria bacterium]|mgnify:CR=1 FL=1|nr:DUF2125 domain-containing protein [Alphaproteobacteria bacterium]OJV45281.1 MAG: hypothetical protein BGO28_00670 [Alphaproteobacteria bacterium 43-37]